MNNFFHNNKNSYGQGSHTAGVMKWRATSTGTAYFVLKVGTNKTSFSYTFDNITLLDLTDIETGMNGDIPLLNGKGQTTNDHALYDLSGRKWSMAGGQWPKPQGIYILSDGTRSQKVMMRTR